MSALLVGGVLMGSVTSTQASQVKQELEPRRSTAVGAVIGLSSSGLALRHYWGERLGTQVSAYSTFGRRYGVYAVGTQLQVVAVQRKRIRLFLSVPVRYVYTREPTERAANFGPDPKVVQRHEFRFGAGPSLEVFLGPLVGMTLEVPVVFSDYLLVGARKGVGQTPNWFPAPNLGIYVYFR